MADNRFLAIGLSEAAGECLLKSFDGFEQLGQPFSYRCEVLTEKEFDSSGVIGENATVRMALADGGTRYFNGFIGRCVHLANTGRLFRYELTLVPFCWFLTRQADCRVFHKNSPVDLLKKTKVPEIVTEVWKSAGFSDSFKLDKLGDSYPERDMTVQYRETTFNFCQRLLEQEGIYYYFDHADGKHTLVLCDSPANHDPCTPEEIPFRLGSSGPTTDEQITEWVFEREFQPANAALADFDYLKPKTPLRPTGTGTVDVGDHSEIFDYPGGFTETSDGDRLAKIRSEELTGQEVIIRGRANFRNLCVGYKFKLAGNLREDQKGEYIVTSVTHRAVNDVGDSGESEGSQSAYVCSFVARLASRQFRPVRTAPKPLVSGPQTAIVVGPDGDEIHVDPDGYGRVKLQFHWDRYGVANENSSPWIRVAQNWAGKKWGVMFHPRIGQEVIVEFLEGDPDKPIITGRVYNNENMPPYNQEFKTMSTIKSCSSPDGEGFNEFRFEDKKGEEQIFMHAQKNMDVRVKNDSYQTIEHDKHLKVGNDEVQYVKHDRNITIDNDLVSKVGRDHNETIKGKEAREITGSMSLKVEDDVIEEFKKKQSTQVTEDYYLKAKNIVLEAVENITIKINDKIFMALDSKGIGLGSSGKIQMESTGDTGMKATGNMKIEGTGGVKIESSATLDAKGSTATIDGGSSLTLKGGSVMIN